MEARLQRRIQRYGWDLAAHDYEPLWQAQLAAARVALFQLAALAPCERVLDVACGTGLVALEAARAVGPAGHVLGTDISGGMIEVARQRAAEHHVANIGFARMDAEALDLPDASFDVVLCALGLMYVPNPLAAVREWLRVLRPGGRVVIATWGQRGNCGWSPVFSIVDAEVRSEVCPLFFNLGAPNALAQLCADAGLAAIKQRRIGSTLDYAGAEEACDAAFIGGPVALAWSRFNDEARARARVRYVEALEPWRTAYGYRIPGEFVIAAGTAPTSGFRPMDG